MRFGHVELPVAKPLGSMSFYVDVLGFELVANQQDTFIWVRCGEVEILLKPRGESTPSIDCGAKAFGELSNLCLYCDDVEQEAARLRAAGVEVTTVPGGCFHFRDLDGHLFQLVDPRGHQA